MSRVVVVGAGVVGLCTAWSLQRRGHEVLVLDGASPRDAASWGNAGWLVPWLVAFARSCTAARHDAGTLATLELSRDVHSRYDELLASGVEFSMERKGMRFVGLTREAVEKELELLAATAALGYAVPDEVDDAEATRAAEPLLGEAVAASACLAGDAHLDPRELVRALEAWLVLRGVEVDRSRRVTGFSSRGGTVNAVRTERGRVLTDAVVIAAGAWSGALARELRFRMPLQAGKGYSFSVDLVTSPSTPLYLLEGRVALTGMAGRVRCAGMMELSGVDPRVDPRRLRALARHASAYLREWPGDDAVTDAWAGLRPMTPDGLPVIGFVPGSSNALVATGHAMLGVTLGPTTGEAIADLLDGKEDERLVPFSPDRF